MKNAFAFIVSGSISRLDIFLSENLNESRTFIQEQIKSGRVLVNEKVILKPSHLLSLNDKVTGSLLEEKKFDLEPLEYDLSILYEDKELLAVNKPQGMVVHPASGYNGPTLVHHLLYYFKNNKDFKSMDESRPGIVHRLDRGTSGVILVAKNRKSQEALSSLFKKRLIKKEYEAIAWGKVPSEGHIENIIGRDRKDRKKMSSKCDVGRNAVTDYKLIKFANNYSHVALFPKTGRTHQLRVHLSELKHPIVGDKLYGSKLIEGIDHTLLHAKKLEFTHPLSETVLSIEAPRPKVFDVFLKNLNNTSL